MKQHQSVQIQGSPGATIRDVSLTATSGREPEPETVPARVRILFMAFNPEGTTHLRLDLEVKAITEALRGSRLGDQFELQQIWAAGDRDIQDGLLRFQPDILHLSGHASREGRLLLERERTMRDLSAPPSPVLPEEDLWLAGLVRVFAAVRGKIRCVVINACHSEGMAQALAQIAGCVVGMSEAIGDEAAIRFSWSFYNALGHGLNVKAAFDAARGEAAMGGWSLDRVPRLVTLGVDPAGLAFG
jgi:CHAT domain